MSQSFFGERYFATRERIAQVLSGIHRLASDTGADLGEDLSSVGFEKDLGSPFLFVVCGEVNAGKSTLINGLFGKELCRVNILPETDHVIWYRYGAAPRDEHVTPALEEKYRPVEFLKDFNLVDTPGTNSVVRGHQEITERFMPVADLILFVFPVANPWGAATWNFISRLAKESHPRMVFVIQQADQRDPGDVKIILEHLADLSMKRIGMFPPLFAVSGKHAYEAKRREPFGERLYRSSGFAELEDFVSRRVCDSPEKRAALQTWRVNASRALAKIEERIEQQTRVLGEQGRFLEAVESEIDVMREHLVSRLPRHLANVAEVFQTEAVWVTKSLTKWLGVASSFYRVFMGDRTGSETESLFIERLRQAVETVAESDGVDVVEACKGHWSELGTRVKELIGTDIDKSESVDEKLEQARRRFVQRIGRAAHQAIGNLHLRKQLERELRMRNLALKSFTASTLVFLILGALCGIFGFTVLPFVFCAAALLFLGGGIWIALITRHRITRDFQNSLLDTCGAFAETLRTDYEDALRIFFQDYMACLASVRKHLAGEKLAIEPNLSRWHKLFLTLKSIEQDI